MQLFFSEKRKTNSKITLVGKKVNTIFKDHLASEDLNKFLENATKSLQINYNSYTSLILIATELNPLKKQ